MSDVLRPNIFATGAGDDATAAGQIFPAAGIYQATPTEVDNGDVGRVRMSARRVLLSGADAEYAPLGEETWSAETDARDVLQVEWPRWARQAKIYINNVGDQAISVAIYESDDNTIINGLFAQYYSVASDVSAGAKKSYGPQAAGAGASRYAQVAGLGQNNYPMYIRLRITPAAAMTGTVRALIAFSS